MNYVAKIKQLQNKINITEKAILYLSFKKYEVVGINSSLHLYN
jgi:hypothetical protein